MSPKLPTVDRPVDRERIREVDEGYLVTCTATRCDWQGVFPTAAFAERAVNNHVARERRRPEYTYHAGQVTVHLVDLIDNTSARATTASHHVYMGDPGPQAPISFDLDTFGPAFPRVGHQRGVDERVTTGDLIETSNGREGKVWKTRETRSLGLPTWTIVYVQPDVDDWPTTDQDIRRHARWLNELVIAEDTIVCRYGPDSTHEVLGQAEGYQNLLASYGGGTS